MSSDSLIAISKTNAWLRALPFLLLHVFIFTIYWVGWSWIAVGTAVFLYLIRMFAITGGYHRYFSHKTYKTSRLFQFCLAFLGNTSAQRGPLWWAAHHRHHHAHSDKTTDTHSPRQKGFMYSHMLWVFVPSNWPTKMELVKDFAKFPELRFLNKYDKMAPLVLMATMYFFGHLCYLYAPQLNTTGPQMLIWGFLISTLVLGHATFTINSLTHVWGSRRYKTTDDSRNNLFLALITLGEGWHNNHHRYQGCVRQGFFWWEIDLTYYTLWTLSKLGIVWDLKPVPAFLKKVKPTESLPVNPVSAEPSTSSLHPKPLEKVLND